MPSSTKNVKLGPCKVYFDGADLGVTKGGVEVSVTTETYMVNVDQFGKTTINELIMSRNVKVKAPLAETTLRNMIATMPGASLISDGAVAATALTFTAPAATTTFTIGGVAFTFTATTVARPASKTQVQLAAVAADSVQNACDAINRALVYSTTTGVALTNNAGGVTARVRAGFPLIIDITAADPGTAGNAVTSVATVGATMGTATLLGGLAETKARVETKTGIGTDLLSIAKVLRLHPTGKADSDFSDDFVVYQAATAGALTFSYQVDAERVYAVEFAGYPDALDRLFAVGDLLA
jgi:hypothetical protein